jgi:hypothetical protein
MVRPSLYSVHMDRLATPHVLHAAYRSDRTRQRPPQRLHHPTAENLVPTTPARCAHRFDAVERAGSSRVIVYCVARTNSRTTRVLHDMLDQTIQVHTVRSSGGCGSGDATARGGRQRRRGRRSGGDEGGDGRRRWHGRRRRQLDGGDGCGRRGRRRGGRQQQRRGTAARAAQRATAAALREALLLLRPPLPPPLPPPPH